jgi:hypothetical protein
MKRLTPRGKRGKRLTGAVRRDIHSHLDGLPSGSHSGQAHKLTSNSTAALVVDAAKYFACAAIEENRDDYIVPRQSLTRRLLLEAFPQQVETAPIPTRQLDKQTGELVETTDNRITWKSDKTLLRRNKPFEQIGTFKREGSVSEGLNTRKYRGIEHETPTSEDVQELGPALDHETFE